MDPPRFRKSVSTVDIYPDFRLFPFSRDSRSGRPV